MTPLTWREDVLDAATCASLRQSVGWTAFPEVHIAAILARSLRTLLVTQDGTPVAMARRTA